MGRPRGYAEWNPKPETVELIGQVNAVLDEYREHLPMTVRQIFYRLVGAYGYDKTEKAYGRLCEHLVRARRAELVPFNVIRDDGNDSAGGDWGYDDPEAFIEDVRESADSYRRPIRQGQRYRVELWCEAKGMVPMIARVARAYGVRVFATGGFASVTTTHEIALRALQANQPTRFLHIGDYDPSGESIFDSIAEDAAAFVWGERSDDTMVVDGERVERFVPERVALTRQQVEQHNLPTAPPKGSDSRSGAWAGETCQAEAMPPDLLTETVHAALARYTDLDLLHEVDAKGDAEREQLQAKLAEIMEAFDDAE